MDKKRLTSTELAELGELLTFCDTIQISPIRAFREIRAIIVKGGEKTDQRAEQNTATAAVGMRGSEEVGTRLGGGGCRKRREGVALTGVSGSGRRDDQPVGTVLRARLWLRRKLSPFISRIWT